MRRHRLRLWPLTAALLPLLLGGADAGARPVLTVQRVLVPATADAAHLTGLRDSVAVTPDGVALVGDSAHLWAVGASGVASVPGVPSLDAFAFSSDGVLFGIRGRELVYLDTGGVPRSLFTLPADGMRIVPGAPSSMLLFGPEGPGQYGLYVLQPGRRITKILQSPRPIASAAQSGHGILLVAGGALYMVADGRLVLVAGEPGGAFSSVAIDRAGGRIYVCDGSHLFQVKDGHALALAPDLGGQLLWVGGGLLVFDPAQRILLRLLGLP